MGYGVRAAARDGGPAWPGEAAGFGEGTGRGAGSSGAGCCRGPWVSSGEAFHGQVQILFLSGSPFSNSPVDRAWGASAEGLSAAGLASTAEADKGSV